LILRGFPLPETAPKLPRAPTKGLGLAERGVENEQGATIQPQLLAGRRASRKRKAEPSHTRVSKQQHSVALEQARQLACKSGSSLQRDWENLRIARALGRGKRYSPCSAAIRSAMDQRLSRRHPI